MSLSVNLLNRVTGWKRLLYFWRDFWRVWCLKLCFGQWITVNVYLTLTFARRYITLLFLLTAVCSVSVWFETNAIILYWNWNCDRGLLRLVRLSFILIIFIKRRKNNCIWLIIKMNNIALIIINIFHKLLICNFLIT